MGPLSISDARRVALSVFGWYGFLIVAALGMAYGLLFRKASRVENGEPIKAKVLVRSQLWLWAMGGFFALVGVACIDDVFHLAMTFRYWGILALGIYLWPIWFIARLFSLNHDNVADYTMDDAMRRSIDVKWQEQLRANNSLRKQLLLWIGAVAAATLWLLHLVNLPFIALLNFFK